MATHPIDRNTPYGGLSSLVALKGIGTDKNLVHMSDEEIRHLEMIAGKPMTTNPETGLPQAFDFGNALASAAAIAATIYAPELSPMFFGASAPVLAGGAYGLTSLATHAGQDGAFGNAAMGALTTYGMGELGGMLGKDPSMAADTVGLPAVTEGVPGANEGLAAKIAASDMDFSGGGGNYTELMKQPLPSVPDSGFFVGPPEPTPTPSSWERLSNNVSNRVSDTGKAWSNAFSGGEAPMSPQGYTALKTSAPTEEGFFSKAKEGVTKGTSYTPQQLADKGYTQYSPSTLDRLANNKTAILGGIGQAYFGGSPDAPEPTKPINRPVAPSYYGSKVAVGGKRTGSPTSSQNALDIALGRAPNKQQFTPLTYEDNPDYEGPQAAVQSGGLTGMMATGGAIRKMAQDLQKKGNNGDTILAHINKREAALLKRAGGSGTVNPKTGLLQFEDGDSSAGDWAGSAGADGEGGGGASSSGASDGGASSAGDWAGSAGADGMGGGGASMGGGAAGGNDNSGGYDGGASMDGMGNFGMGAPGGGPGFGAAGPGSGLSGLDQTGLGPSGPSKQDNLGRSADDIDLEEADQNSKNAPPAGPWQDPDTPVSNYFQNLVANPGPALANLAVSAVGAAVTAGMSLGVQAAVGMATQANSLSGTMGGPSVGGAMFGGPATGTGGTAAAGQGNQNQGNSNGPGTATADIGQSQSMAMAQAPSAPAATGPQMGLGGDSGVAQPYYPPRVAQGGGLVSLATGGQAQAPRGKQYFEGQVTGPGDGMSDEVPFDIHNSKPNKALLSKDEYVLPADVVSMIGNGSSNAGAEEIDRFVAHIRKKAHGVSKQQKQLKGSKGLQSLVA